jgi:hypothetical protein
MGGANGADLVNGNFSQLGQYLMGTELVLAFFLSYLFGEAELK